MRGCYTRRFNCVFGIEGTYAIGVILHIGPFIEVGLPCDKNTLKKGLLGGKGAPQEEEH